MIIQLLRANNNFRKYYIANTISSIGDYIDDIAFAQLVFLITKSTIMTSYVFAIKIVFTFLSIFSSALADRLNKKKLVIIGELMQGVLLIVLFVLYYVRSTNAYVLIIFVTLQALFSTIGSPAKNALLSVVLEKRELLTARATISLSSQFIEVFSFAFSATIISFFKIPGCIAADIITFMISSYLFSTIKCNYPIIPYTKMSDFINDVKDGFKFVKRTGVIAIILFLSFCGNILMSPVDTLLPAYFKQGGFDIAAYSIFMSIIAAGGMITNLFLPKIEKTIQKKNLLVFGFASGALGCIILYNNNFIVPFIAALFIGISYSLVSILNATILQINTPDNMIARIFSIFKCISYIAGPLGIVVAGSFGEIVPMNVIYLVAGIMMSVLTIISYVFFKTNSRLVFVKY